MQSIWDILARTISMKFGRKEMSVNDVSDFLESIYNDVESPVREYRYLHLIRLALEIEDFNFIIRLKQQMVEGRSDA